MSLECPECGDDVPAWATYSADDEVLLSCGCRIPAIVWEHRLEQAGITDESDAEQENGERR